MLHDWSEQKHKQAEVKEFLFGLKEDLNSDIKEMEQDKLSYKAPGYAFNYITSLKPKDEINTDSLEKHRSHFFRLIGLVSYIGRFEGFKSSGKIGNIENKVLQNDVMDLYQENIPSLINTTNFISSFKRDLTTYMLKNRIRTSDSTTNILTLYNSEEFYNTSNILKNMDEVIAHYDSCIYKMKRIVTAIDKTYYSK